ncbi:peptidase M15B and M15C DD-carboxypeptidase VanY/endolysin [Beutenbergia cavernae DSM 12333]|uniref:Peptidase M15B and M15C DD-carboxypeptidase VanY/endolysin n=1 Tax=Beutenbergia cavernae (strain ATCC BAA-8 / DSM 12333 / CCUG 43141 / JCM 11478 / NBRC 16432 / NCIMB 13614 / HKI 0122) TaxID=471853 RepID=C5BY53_BEUC1|nr:peptidase M15B and M15C DD-carboxypeptidase VanY/endolysin [Beutenbergia cavernae DSM 12333]
MLAAVLVAGAFGAARLLAPGTEPTEWSPAAEPTDRSPVADQPDRPPASTGGEAATGLDPELERRFELAQAAAAEDGVPLTLTSGWRTAEEQQALVDDAVRRYGSVDEAHRWVLPPDTSEHVAGAAIDVGPTDGALWLGEHGWEFGLCRTYANEVWHFEATIEPGGTCGEMFADASHGWD